MLSFRPACDGDLDRILEIHANAFPDPRGAEERRRNFTHNPWARLDDLVVAEDAGAIVAHAFLFSLRAWFGGAPVRVGGIASVGVAPEARGRRVAGALLDHVHAASAARGDALTMLYAFRQAFYRRSGYVPVTPMHRVIATPRSIPDAWRREAAQRPLRPARSEDFAGLRAAYLRAAARGTGWLDRTDRFWEARVIEERRTFLVADGPSGVAGYIAWHLAQTEAHAPITLHVDEVIADDAEVRRRLLGAIGLQRDQVAEVTIDVDAADPLDRALVDADGHRHGDALVEHPTGLVVGGPLVRIDDVRRAIEARGYARDGDVVIDAGDAGAWSATFREGRARVEPAKTGAAPDLATDLPGLAAILYGALSPSDAIAIGWARGPSNDRVDALDGIFALPPFFALDPF